MPRGSRQPRRTRQALLAFVVRGGQEIVRELAAPCRVRLRNHAPCGPRGRPSTVNANPTPILLTLLPGLRRSSSSPPMGRVLSRRNPGSCQGVRCPAMTLSKLVQQRVLETAGGYKRRPRFARTAPARRLREARLFRRRVLFGAVRGVPSRTVLVGRLDRGTL